MFEPRVVRANGFAPLLQTCQYGTHSGMFFSHTGSGTLRFGQFCASVFELFFLPETQRFGLFKGRPIAFTTVFQARTVTGDAIEFKPRAGKPRLSALKFLGELPAFVI